VKLGWLLLVPGVLMAIWAAVPLIQAAMTATWQASEAQLLSFDTEPGPRGKVRIKPRYAYEVGGDRYESNVFSKPDKLVSAEEAETLVIRYRSGRTVDFYYNRSNPSDSALRTDFPAWAVVVAVVGMSLLAYGLALVRK
jgi:hypothetical protein